MRFSSILCSAALLLVPAVAAADAPAPVRTSPAAPASTKANDFNTALYGALRAQSGNLFFSAPSIRQAVGVAALGARGTTAAELQRALRLESDPSLAGDDAKQEIADLDAAKGSATLAVANRLWADKTFVMQKDFTANAARGWGAPVETVDFQHQANASRLTINGWVASKTNDRIKDLLPPPAINADTALVITNAIYFKGSWGHAFDKSATRDQAFFADRKNAVQVPTMHQVEHFKLAQRDGMKMLEMPYEKSDLAMDVVLPDAQDGLPAIEDAIGKGQLISWTASLSSARVDVAMPKVSFSWGGSVKKTLGAMGAHAAFDPGTADFTGMAQGGRKLWIDDVIHKAFVAIDEQGSEAAASTAVIISRETASVPTPPVKFEANHPFVFLIRDTKHNRVLFMGRVTNPKS